MMKLSARGAVSGGAQGLSFTARLIGGRQHTRLRIKKVSLEKKILQNIIIGAGLKEMILTLKNKRITIRYKRIKIKIVRIMIYFVGI